MPKPEILSVTTVPESRAFRIEKVALRFSNGEERLFERFSDQQRNAVMVIPLQPDDTVLLIREYGVGLEDYHLSLPKGGIEAGEAPEVAAQRELMEEAGVGANKITHVKRMSSSPSYSRNAMHLLLAEDLYPAKLQGDEPEPIEVVPWSLNNLDALFGRDDFHESRAMAALLWIARERGL